MPTKALGRRLERLSQTWIAEPIGRVVIIEPETWPVEVRAAYDAACAAGDHERQADLIEAQTGERPVFPRVGVGVIRDYHLPAVIEIRTHPGRSDEAPVVASSDRQHTSPELLAFIPDLMTLNTANVAF